MAATLVWDNISLAVGAEPRQYPVMTGISGLEHRFLSIAVDEATKRIVVVSPDPDPRVAALTQIDIQAALTNMRVLVARPVVVDLGVLSRQLAQSLGADQIHLGRCLKSIERFNALPQQKKDRFIRDQLGVGLDRISLAFKHVTLPVVAQIVTVIQQASNLDWEAVIQAMREDSGNHLVPLGGLTSIDNMGIDRKHGVCPIPLYELGEDDWNLMNSASDIPAIRDLLKDMGIYQYFFPSPDELAMGFVDGGLTAPNPIERAIEKTDELGHQLGATSIVDTHDNVVGMMKELEEAGYIAEGEFGYEITPEGESFRSTVRVRPKESVITKILNRINVNIDPGSLMK